MPNALYPSIDKFCRNCKGFNLVFDFVSRAASLFGPAVFLKSYIIAVVNAMHLKPGNFYTKYCSFRFIDLCFFFSSSSHGPAPELEYLVVIRQANSYAHSATHQ